MVNDGARHVVLSEPSADLKCPHCGHVIPPPPSGDGDSKVTAPGEAYRQVNGLRYRKTEALVVLTLDAQNALIGKHVVSVGALNTTRTHPREVFKVLVDDQAAGFVLAHNHPSGSLRVSEDDREFTRRIQAAADLMGFSLFDHLVVTKNGYVSFKESGWL
jgi:DNA repair protein RadC